MADNGASRLDTISKLVQVLSVVLGVVISILSFNVTRQQEAVARKAEADARELELRKYYDQRSDELNKQRIEAAKPFLELRQKRYMEAIAQAAVLVSPQDHTPAEIKKARKRFWELYWAELSLVEDVGVEKAMMGLGGSLGPELTPTPAQIASLNLAHVLRDSLTSSWGVSQEKIGTVNR